MAEYDDTSSRLTRTVTATGTRTRASTVTSVTRSSTGIVEDGVFWGRAAAAAVGSALRGALRWLAETVTAPGWLVVCVLVAGALAGWIAGWSLGWVVAVAAATLLVVCIPFLLGSHDYRVQLALDRERVVAGDDVTGRLVVRNAGARPSLPGRVDVPIGTGLAEAYVPLLAAGAEHTEQLSIAAARRGVIDVGPVSVSRGDPVGLLRREALWPEIHTLHVHPVTAIIPGTSAGLIRDLEGLPTNTIVDADLAFHAIRDYVPGDSRRHVHWKSTAKTGRLMVRQYEEARHSRIAVTIGITAEEEYESDDEFELAVSVAASLSLQAVRDGRDLVVTTSAERPELVRGEVVTIRTLPTRSAATMLDGFSEIELAERASRLEDVAKLTAQSHPDLSVVFLVTGAHTPLARLRAASVSFGPDTQCVAVRCDLGADPAFRRLGPLRVLTVGVLDDLGKLITRGALQ